MRMVPRKPEATRAGCSLICSPEHAILHDRLIHVVRGKGHTVTLSDPGPVIRVSKEAAMHGSMIVMDITRDQQEHGATPAGSIVSVKRVR
jgi:hypothetical protein